MLENITIKGARVNNLDNIDVTIPRNKLTVITGVSGSGKSSLAFDTIYAEGQRRYVESLSSYARMFIGQMDKPDVDYIDGLSPSIAIDQKTTLHNPRSTIGTVTEIYDYLRLLWSNIGIRHCPKCEREVSKQTIDEVTAIILDYPENARIMLLAPIVRDKKGEHRKVLEDIKKSGYTRVMIDNVQYDLDEPVSLDKNLRHNIEIVVDRLVIRSSIRRRLTDSIEKASALTGGVFSVLSTSDGNKTVFSLNYSCPECSISLDDLTAKSFSFNNPAGACQECSGLGSVLKADEDRIIPDRTLSILQGAIAAPGWKDISEGSIALMYFEALGDKYGFTLQQPLNSFSKEALEAVLYGTGKEKLLLKYKRSDGYGTIEKDFEGIIPNIERRYNETKAANPKSDLEDVMTVNICSACRGKRLNRTVLSVTVNSLSISDFTDLPIKDELSFINGLELKGREEQIAQNLVKEIRNRLTFLNSIGLGYLTLSRSSSTISGGESQRIRLATQIGSGLVGVLYVLDEPSIGLHQRDNDKLIKTLKYLRDLGNTVIVVEHDEETIRNADYIIDVGPGAGVQGGKIVAAGTADDLCASPSSLTGKYLSGELKINVPGTRRHFNSVIAVRGAAENNLKNVDVDIPLQVFTCVTGVSGSGKSTLVNEIVYKALSRDINGSRQKPGKYKSITRYEAVGRVVHVDQCPIGRTPRSNPATYTGIFSDIREIFASTSEARARGYAAGRFSFNTKGGRCEACEGDGYIRIDMQFLADVYVTCEKCRGKRYNRETLEVRYKGKNISEVLDMTVSEALTFFENRTKIYDKLKTLYDVGLGYIKLGQSSTTLSGGEAQRIKLAAELSKKSNNSTLYILDEPTTGLHFDDISKLISVLNSLVDKGNSVLVIEHNMDVIKCADYIIDLGPEGGDEGGTVVFSGPPEECAACPGSITGQYLKKYLK